MQFTIYENKTGIILKRITCDKQIIDLQIHEGEKYINGDFDDEQYIIVNENPVKKDNSIQIFENLKANKSAEFNNKCAEEIIAGFASLATNKLIHYPSNEKDQLNLQNTIQQSLALQSIEDEYFLYCKNELNVWGYIPHTAKELQQVGIDCYNFILNLRMKNFELQNKIKNSNDVEYVKLLVW